MAKTLTRREFVQTSTAAEPRARRLVGTGVRPGADRDDAPHREGRSS